MTSSSLPKQSPFKRLIWHLKHKAYQSHGILISHRLLIGKMSHPPFFQALIVVSVQTCPRWYQGWQCLQKWHRHCRHTHSNDAMDEKEKWVVVLLLSWHLILISARKIKNYSWVKLPGALEVREVFQYEFIVNHPNVVCTFRWSRIQYKYIHSWQVERNLYFFYS